MPPAIPSIGGCAISVLVLGYGNPGRLDDGLGPAFAAKVQALKLEGVAVESNYQLNLEDAELIAGYEVVVFADASVSAVEPFELTGLQKAPPMIGFSSHSITAESLLGLAAELFEAKPRAYALAIRGYEYGAFGEQLSDRALKNLKAAVAFFAAWAGSGDQAFMPVA